MSIKVVYAWKFNEAIRKIATAKKVAQKVVELSIEVPCKNENTTQVVTLGKSYDNHWGYFSDRIYGSPDEPRFQKDVAKLHWEELDRSIHVKDPDYFEDRFEDGSRGTYFPPKPILFSEFENRVISYFKENKLKLGGFSSDEEKHNFDHWLEEFCTTDGICEPRENGYRFNAADYPFSHDDKYLRVDHAIMINFMDFIGKKEDVIVANYGDSLDKYRIYFLNCPEDGKTAKAKFYEYAKEFKLFEHFKQIFDPHNEVEDVVEYFGIAVKPVSIAPAKKLEEKAEQGNLLDQNGIAIEPGDIIAYPRGGDHNYYCLHYGKVKGNTAQMVVMDDEYESQARHDKVMVIKTNNKNKKLPWEE